MAGACDTLAHLQDESVSTPTGSTLDKQLTLSNTALIAATTPCPAPVSHKRNIEEPEEDDFFDAPSWNDWRWHKNGKKLIKGEGSPFERIFYVCASREKTEC